MTWPRLPKTLSWDGRQKGLAPQTFKLLRPISFPSCAPYNQTLMWEFLCKYFSEGVCSGKTCEGNRIQGTWANMRIQLKSTAGVNSPQVSSGAWSVIQCPFVLQNQSWAIDYPLWWQGHFPGQVAILRRNQMDSELLATSTQQWLGQECTSQRRRTEQDTKHVCNFQPPKQKSFRAIPTIPENDVNLLMST